MRQHFEYNIGILNEFTHCIPASSMGHRIRWTAVTALL